jgi:hypothetical protein
MNQLWETLKNNIGSVLLALGAAGLLVGLGVVFALLAKLANNTAAGPLPVLAIGGVIVLILMLTVVAMIFKILGLTNKEQAMGLPEGSIRAVIALSLIVQFAILAVFLYQGISRVGTAFHTIENLSDAERAQFLRDNPTALDISSKAVVVRDKDGQVSAA